MSGEVSGEVGGKGVDVAVARGGGDEGGGGGAMGAAVAAAGVCVARCWRRGACTGVCVEMCDSCRTLLLAGAFAGPFRAQAGESPFFYGSQQGDFHSGRAHRQSSQFRTRPSLMLSSLALLRAEEHHTASESTGRRVK